MTAMSNSPHPFGTKLRPQNIHGQLRASNMRSRRRSITKNTRFRGAPWILRGAKLADMSDVEMREPFHSRNKKTTAVAMPDQNRVFQGSGVCSPGFLSTTLPVFSSFGLPGFQSGLALRHVSKLAGFSLG